MKTDEGRVKSKKRKKGVKRKLKKELSSLMHNVI